MKFAAYAISAAIGFAIGHYLLEGAAAAYASILISYHLFLVFLVVSATHEKGLSLPVGMTILTHMAFLGLLIGLAYARTHIPFSSLISLFVPALAPFETRWLFSGQDKMIPEEPKEPERVVEATIDDHEAFREYLMQSDRVFRKPGISINEEFNLWFADRTRKKAEAAALAAALAAESASGYGSSRNGPDSGK